MTSNETETGLPAGREARPKKPTKRDQKRPKSSRRSDLGPRSRSIRSYLGSVLTRGVDRERRSGTTAATEGDDGRTALCVRPLELSLERICIVKDSFGEGGRTTTRPAIATQRILCWSTTNSLSVCYLLKI